MFRFLVPKPRIPSVMNNSPSVERLQNLLSGGNSSEATTPDGANSNDSGLSAAPAQQVLMIPFGGQRDPVGLTPEEVFLTAASSGVSASASASGSGKQQCMKDGELPPGNGDATAATGNGGGPPTQEKRTRFSIQNQPDLESVGNNDFFRIGVSR